MSRDAIAADIHQAIVDLADGGRSFALATILGASGSTPRDVGTKAIIDASGAIHGTIGGGQVEAEAQRRAVAAIRSGHPVVFDFALTGRDAEDSSPVCGGIMRILVDPRAASDRVAYAQAADAARHRRCGVLLTRIATAGRDSCTVRVQWLPDDAIALGDLPSPDRGIICSALAAGTAQLLDHDSSQAQTFRQTLIEPVIPPPLLVIAGGGHIGQALALQGSLVGFQVMVVDDRREFTDPSLYPSGTITRCCDIAGELGALSLGDDTYVAIVTRGHQHDQRALAACITRPAAYIGMIGSMRKVAMLRHALLECGAATPEQFDRVHAPIGLDIGAESVPEIALSIMAQMIAVRRRGRAYAASSMPRSA